MRFLFTRRPLVTVVLAVLALVALEFGFQARSQILFGRSVFNEVFSAPTKVYNAELGFHTFRPSARIAGNNAEIVTNSLGLRSPPIDDTPADASLRVAVIGASTVFGAYAPGNSDLMSYRLADMLREVHPARPVELLNAGLPGLTLEQQAVLLDKVVLPFEPDIVIFYPGMNDVSGVCRGADGGPQKAVLEVPTPQLPGWLLSPELVKKNTVWMREKPASVEQRMRSVDAVPFHDYRRTFTSMVAKVRAAGGEPVVATLARAFHPDQPVAKQRALSESFRYYYNCFDLASIHVIYDRFNAMLAEVAREQAAMLADLGAQMPPGRTHFADATHFSVRGEKLAARILFDRIEMPTRGRSEDLASRPPDD